MSSQEVPYSPSFDIAHFSHPARQVSGDLYGYYQRPNGGLAIAVGDVIGKGLAAEVLVNNTIMALARAIEADLPPAETLIQTNGLIQPFISDLQSVGVCLAYLDSGQMWIANAGAISPLVRTQTETEMLVDIGGLPLGTYLSDTWPYENHNLALTPGDIVLLTTDGVVEAPNTEDKIYSFERFETAVASGPTHSAQAVLDHLLADLQQFIGQAEQRDDLTIVVIKAL